MNKDLAEMVYQATQTLAHAYAPYSNFKVACCIRSDQNNLYTGINIENGSYGLTLCAEAAAICQMVSAGEQKIQDVVILAHNQSLCAPCGACRQRLYEFSTPKTRIHLCNEQSIFHSLSMDQMLPLAFHFKPPTG